jgi:tetratricopeptide (TPR) repeat protein
VFSRSNGRQSEALEAASTSGMLGCLAAGADCDKIVSTPEIKNLKLRFMNQVLHKTLNGCLGGEMRRILLCCFALLMSQLPFALSYAQGYPGGGGRASQTREISPSPSEVKPEKAAAKAYSAGTKSMQKAHVLEETIAKATDPDKKAKAMAKLDDTYGRALEEFTEVLRNKNDMYDAWNKIGFIHLHFGAYRESIDDYNHALALQPDLLEAIQHRGEAFMGADHLDEAKAAYMDLFFHARPLADQMMVTMQSWLQSHRATANGMRPADIDAFDKWLQEREGIAKTTAAN